MFSNPNSKQCLPSTNFLARSKRFPTPQACLRGTQSSRLRKRKAKMDNFEICLHSPRNTATSMSKRNSSIESRALRLDQKKLQGTPGTKDPHVESIYAKYRAIAPKQAVKKTIVSKHRSRCLKEQSLHGNAQRCFCLLHIIFHIGVRTTASAQYATKPFLRSCMMKYFDHVATPMRMKEGWLRVRCECYSP